MEQAIFCLSVDLFFWIAISFLEVPTLTVFTVSKLFFFSIFVALLNIIGP